MPDIEAPSGARPHAAAIEAVRAEAKAARGALQNRFVGAATITGNTDSGVRLLVANPLIDLGEGPPGQLSIVGSTTHQRQRVHRVISASAERVEVEVELTFPTGGDKPLGLWLQVDPAAVPEAFLADLERVEDLRVGAALLPPAKLTEAAPVDDTRFNSEQRRAFGALTTAGLSAVWGPPGTGKTRVIGAAIARLVEEGHTVAVVSNTNIAVDQALIRAMEEIESPDVGTVIRVGHASLDDVVDHPWLLVQKATAAMSSELIAALSDAQGRLAELRADPREASYRDLERIIGNRDAEAIQECCTRQQRAAQVDSVASRTERLGREADELERHRSLAHQAHEAARLELDRIRDFLFLPRVEQEMAELETEISRLESRLWQYRQERANPARSQVARGKREVDKRARAVGRLLAKLENARVAYLRKTKTIAAAQAAGVTAADVKRAQEAEIETGWKLEALTEALESCRLRYDDSSSELDAIRKLAPITEAEEQLILEVDQVGSVEMLLVEWRRRQADRAALGQLLTDTTDEVEQLERQLEEAETKIIKTAKVVGTTLAQMTIHRELSQRAFDFVIIDEASAAFPPYALAALTRAEQGATLVGDFEQNSPITNRNATVDDAEARRWLDGDPFAILGVTDGRSADEEPGCVVLSTQYRFGNAALNLANSIAYSGHLRQGRELQTGPDPEIVVVDTSTLGGAGLSERVPGRSGRWWAAGAAIACEIASRHGLSDIGIITPYRLQVDLIADGLISRQSARVEVGTAHAFQGRQFRTTVFDLVEDGSGTSWLAKARRSRKSFERDGLRVFTVGVTRHTERLYIICSMGTISAARRGPLRSLRQAIEYGDATIVDARSIIGTAPEQAASPDLTRLGTGSGGVLLDDVQFFDMLRTDFDRARERVVLFSPFLGARTNSLLPQLRALSERGVAVTAFVKSAAELHRDDLIHTLASAGVNVKERCGMHEKIVIIDSVAYLGSLNVLSNTGETLEMMMRFEGAQATRIADWMKSVARESITNATPAYLV